MTLEAKKGQKKGIGFFGELSDPLFLEQKQSRCSVAVHRQNSSFTPVLLVKSFEEDRCRVKNRQAAETLAVLRNLTIRLYELERDRDKTQAPSLKTWLIV